MLASGASASGVRRVEAVVVVGEQERRGSEAQGCDAL